jgi:outer membrane protein
VGALLLIAVTAGLASAQPLTVGTVDTNRIGTEYKAMQQLNDQYGEFRRQQEQKLMERQKVMMLSEADHTKYFDLVQTAAPTDATKQQIADLEALSRQREERHRALSEKKDRAEAEQKEYGELNTLYTTRAGDMRALQEGLMKALEAKREELTKVFTTSLEAAIKAVIEGKALSVVVAKEAVLYGGTDITTEVLAKLNAPPSAPAK